MKALAAGLCVVATSTVLVQSVGAQSTYPAAATAKSGSTATTPADNTKTNETNASNMAATADAQKDDTRDLGLTKRIRQSVMADKSLSTYAHNVKIVSVNGTVTLNGVVRSIDEKRSIAMKAEAVAGKEHVVNDLKISPPK